MNKTDISNIYQQAKKIYYSFIHHDYDTSIILIFLKKYLTHQKQAPRILDIGCGYGKKLIALQEAGYDVLGVDVNHEIVEKNQKQGLNCITVEEFSQQSEQFDVLLMSHIIEHFNPPDLKDFMDSYLDKLKLGGYLIVATPLFTEYFYDDFDHIKPYSPVSIMMVFGKGACQVQYYARNKLSLTDLNFRRRHYRFTFVRGKFVRNTTTKFYQVLEFISRLLYLVSCGLFGRKDGWVGIFRKI